MLPWDFLHTLRQFGSQNLWSSGLISQKTILIFPKNFLDFRLDTVEKQSFINLNSDSSKSYAFVVPIDSNVTFFDEGEDAAFCPFLSCILVIDSVA